MFYDVAHRHNQALDPSALSLVATSLHALTRAIDDCRNAGKDSERDPAVLLLARHLGTVATQNRPTDLALRRRCLDDIAEIGRTPALVALAFRGVGCDPSAKTTFHAEARRALLRLAEALELDEGSYTVRSDKGAAATSGEIILEAHEVVVRVWLLPMGQGREVAYRRAYAPGRSAPLHWASIRELVPPGRFAARLRRELHLTPGSRQPTRLFA